MKIAQWERDSKQTSYFAVLVELEAESLDYFVAESLKKTCTLLMMVFKLHKRLAASVAAILVL